MKSEMIKFDNETRSCHRKRTDKMITENEKEGESDRRFSDKKIKPFKSLSISS